MAQNPVGTVQKRNDCYPLFLTGAVAQGARDAFCRGAQRILTVAISSVLFRQIRMGKPRGPPGQAPGRPELQRASHQASSK
jgi:hypothetical protein